MSVTDTAGARRGFDRRSFLKLAGGAAAVGAIGAVGLGNAGSVDAAGTHPSTNGHRFIALTGGDGWVSMPEQAVPISPIWPDDYAPAGTDLYVFGFRDVTAMHNAQYLSNGKGLGKVTLKPGTSLSSVQGQAVACAPLLWCNAHEDVFVRLYNTGLVMRPDLGDSHTFHWHGFPNQVPYFDGVPEPSLSVPVGNYSTYRYIPTEPGTYMYHCHFEDVEHVQMGMQGMVFVNPKNWAAGDVSTYFAYDGTGPIKDDTRYARQYSFMLNEFDVRAHYNDSHLQTTNWIDYHPTFGLLNGRSYPDTIAPNTDPDNPPAEADPLYRLRFQPLSSLVQAQPGERILIRIANLGFQTHSLVSPGVEMQIVGVDGKYVGPGRAVYQNLANRPVAGSRVDERWLTNRIDVAAGESRDVILTAPSAEGTYEIYDRNVHFARSNDGSSMVGSMRTHLQVRAGLPTQTRPNQTF